MIIWSGEAGTGKSFACYTLGLACATATPWLGYAPVRPLRVVYFDQENSRPDRDQYLRWAWHGLGRPSLERIGQNFWVQHFALGASDWAVRAQHAVDAIQPDLIFIDTATPCCAILDENDNGVATQTVNKLRTLMHSVPQTASMVVLKHSRVITEQDLRSDGSQDGQEPRRTIRGAKAWVGMADAVWFHVRAYSGPRADGLANTFIDPSKTRAFGLRHRINISPRWTNNRDGLILERA